MSAAKRVSPGGALLRSSRMFAMPDPIPPPHTSGLGWRSPTATQQFPTHQTITTTPDSRARGDWGLKRPLPLRTTTRATFPMLRVRAMDTLEGITDFSSATDYGITLLKFQELRLPLSIPRVHEVSSSYSGENRSSKWLNKSVFEEDVTAISVEDRPAHQRTRWKFTGPWLGGMGEGKFKEWVVKQVRPRRAEFREFLRGKIAAERHAAAVEKARLRAVEAGQEPRLPKPVDASSITDNEILLYVRSLRGDENNEAIFDHVGQFLDLPPLTHPNNTSTPRNPYAQAGPPATHPSAGISYLRTSGFLDNHPFYGPQESHPPLEARILKTVSQGAVGSGAVVGLAGFVTMAHAGLIKNLGTIPEVNLKQKGGTKMWLQPHRASVNSTGGIEIDVDRPKDEATIVAMELLGEDDSKTFGRPHLKKQQVRQETLTASSLRNKYVRSEASAYGLGGGRP